MQGVAKHACSMNDGRLVVMVVLVSAGKNSKQKIMPANRCKDYSGHVLLLYCYYTIVVLLVSHRVEA